MIKVFFKFYLVSIQLLNRLIILICTRIRILYITSNIRSSLLLLSSYLLLILHFMRTLHIHLQLLNFSTLLRYSLLRCCELFLFLIQNHILIAHILPHSFYKSFLFPIFLPPLNQLTLQPFCVLAQVALVFLGTFEIHSVLALFALYFNLFALILQVLLNSLWIARHIDEFTRLHWAFAWILSRFFH